MRELKDRLSAFLKAVEAGATIVVTSHGQAIAALVSHRDDALPALPILKATRPFGSVAFRRRGRGRTESLSSLLEERRRR